MVFATGTCAMLHKTAASAISVYCTAVGAFRPEPIMLKILPIILSRISQKILLLFFLLFLYSAYYSVIILIQYISVASHLVFKMLL